MTRYRVVPERSQLDAEARSSLHPVHVKSQGLTGFLEIAEDGGAVTLAAPFRVEISAERLRSGNGLLDGELQRRLETRKYPSVLGEVAAVVPLAAGRVRLRGELSLHGVTRTTDAEVTLKQLDAQTVEVEGEKTIDMRDYGLTPPKLLMLRVYPEVKVHARLVAVREVVGS